MDDEDVIAAMRNGSRKAVIGLNLCPFAKAVYVKNQVRFVVSHAPHLDGLLEDLDRELDFLAAADPEEVDTTLLIHPTLLPDFLDFNDFMQLADAAVDEHGLDGVIQIASFHPAFPVRGHRARRHRQLHQPGAVPHPAPVARGEHRTRGGGLSRGRNDLPAQYRDAEIGQSDRSSLQPDVRFAIRKGSLGREKPAECWPPALAIHTIRFQETGDSGMNS
jgi:hypothetical protein